MTKTIISLFLLCRITIVACQVSNLNVIASSGGSFVNSDLKVTWTVGETFIGDLSNSSYSMDQGFHQGSVVVYAMDVDDPVQDMNVMVFPNPTSDHITVSINDISTAGWRFELINMEGKSLLHRDIENQSFQIDFTCYRSGTYFLKISNANAYSKVFTLIKQ